MRADSILQKMEIYLAATVAAALVCGIGFALSSLFAVEDYSAGAASGISAKAVSSPAPESQPALLEPAFRSLDGVSYHG